MAITSIDIDPDKIQRVKDITGVQSNREAVDLALTQLIDNERFGAERIAAFINDTQGATVEGLADR